MATITQAQLAKGYEQAKTAYNEKEETKEKLRKWFPRGSTVYTVLRRVSKSGMSRKIAVLCLIVEGDKIIDLHPNYAVGKVLGWRVEQKGDDGIIVSGCGMDMGFHLAYSLSQVLYGDGYALKHRWL